MTLGINCTSNDPVFGWEDMRPPKRTPEEVDYIEAREAANEHWQNFYQMVDSWIAVGNNDAMENAKIKGHELDGVVVALYKRIGCPHHHTHIEGNQWFSHETGSVEDNCQEICDACGGRVRFHKVEERK